MTDWQHSESRARGCGARRDTALEPLARLQQSLQ